MTKEKKNIIVEAWITDDKKPIVKKAKKEIPTKKRVVKKEKEKPIKQLNDLGFIGTIFKLSSKQITELRKLIRDYNFVTKFRHGGQIGCDEYIHNAIIKLTRKRIVIHPAKNSQTHGIFNKVKTRIKRPREMFERNKSIVDNSTTIVALPNLNKIVATGLVGRTIDYAMERGVFVLIIYPNGKTEGIDSDPKEKIDSDAIDITKIPFFSERNFIPGQTIKLNKSCKDLELSETYERFIGDKIRKNTKCVVLDNVIDEDTKQNVIVVTPYKKNRYLKRIIDVKPECCNTLIDNHLNRSMIHIDSFQKAFIAFNDLCIKSRYCACCRCKAVEIKHGFFVCEFHKNNKEDKKCPNCKNLFRRKKFEYKTSNINLVHGVVENNFSNEKKRYYHAWIEINNKIVLDVSNESQRLTFKKRSYYKQFGVIKVRKYNYDSVELMSKKYGHYGHWWRRLKNYYDNGYIKKIRPKKTVNESSKPNS